jgi:para-aminobenzoate synthetase component I
MSDDSLEKKGLKDKLLNLPSFLSTPANLNDFELKSSEDILSYLPENESLVYLESGKSGKKKVFIGESWSVEVYAYRIEFTINGETESIERKSFSISEVLNTIEDWLGKQKHCQLGLCLMYEAGWDGETRKAQISRLIPDLSVICPQEILVIEDEKVVEYIKPKNEKSLLRENKYSFKKYYASECSIKNKISREVYVDNVLKIKEKIRSGHSFQVNFSQAFEAVGRIDLFSWARELFENEAGMYSCLVIRDKFKVLSISPERLVAKEGDELITRPIAGTFGKDMQFDKAETALNAFKSNQKELAEHNMLIDLERNDLGKVSKPGSVYVHEYLCVEELPHLYHLVSEVRSKISNEKGCGDVVESMFPGGTITGCPKLETMFILNALEEEERFAYTGSVGYMEKNKLDLNILIRTAMLINDKVTMRFGGGIVWDSDPESEYRESLTKAKGLIESLIKGGASSDFDHRSLRQFFT